MMTHGDIFDIKRFAIHDGPGIRTTVFMRGCPLRCWWCHNPESTLEAGVKKECAGFTRKRFHSSEALRPTGPKVDLRSLMFTLARDRIFYKKSSGGITISGGEPLMQDRFLSALLLDCRRKGFHTALDTSGYAPWELLEKAASLSDMILYDIKLMDDSLHEKYTGVSNRMILENLDRIEALGKDLWIRIPLVPGITDTTENIDSIIELLRGYDNIGRICLLPYNMIGEDKFRRLGMKYRPGPIRAQKSNELDELKGRFSDSGLVAVIGG